MSRAGQQAALPPSGFSELARRYKRGRDYEITTVLRPSSGVAIIAPHAGAIENGTSSIATEIAGDDFNLYLFEGRLPYGNFDRLRVTSHCFDEPECLAMIRSCDIVLSVHGARGQQPVVYTGGLNEAGKGSVTDALIKDRFSARADGHQYPGKHPLNICNRGATGAGIQIECSSAIRQSAQSRSAVAISVRGALISLSGTDSSAN